MGRRKNAYEFGRKKTEEKRPFGSSRRRWKDNVRMDLRKTVWDGVDWIHLAQDRNQ
jgi:hypothetical protein